MKKYFLLATTALLLSTSNVMAEVDGVGTVSATINVAVNVQKAPSIEVVSDLDWGTIYVSECSGSDEAIARFSEENGFEIGEQCSVTAYGGQKEGIIRVNNLPKNGALSISDMTTLGDGDDNILMLGNRLSLVDEGEDFREYMVLSDLQMNGAESGSFSGTITVTLNY